MARGTQLDSNAPRAGLHSGFSLIELLITVAIILIIAAIAIPNFLRSKMAANQADAAQDLRNMVTAVSMYDSAWNNGYPPTLDNLGGPSGSSPTCDAAQLLDPILTTPPYTKSGYVFSYTGINGTVSQGQGCGNPGFLGFLITALPASKGMTGNNSFCADEQGAIHVDMNGQQAGTEAQCEAMTPLQ
jgi:type IV pilus assembly protein PilA